MHADSQNGAEYGSLLLITTTAFGVVFLSFGTTAEMVLFVWPYVESGNWFRVVGSLAFLAAAWITLLLIAVAYRPEAEQSLLGPYLPSHAMTRYYKVWKIIALVLGIQLAIGDVVTSAAFRSNVYALHEHSLFAQYESCCGYLLPLWIFDFYSEDAANRGFFMVIMQILIVHLTAFVWTLAIRSNRLTHWSLALFGSALSIGLLWHYWHSLVVEGPPLPAHTTL